jgi:hypothetical protein
LNQNHSNTQQICAEALNIPVVQTEAVKTQKDKSKRLEITFTADQFAKYEQVRDQLAHKNFQKKRIQSMADVMETMFDELLIRYGRKATQNIEDATSAEGTIRIADEAAGAGNAAATVVPENDLAAAPTKNAPKKNAVTGMGSSTEVKVNAVTTPEPENSKAWKSLTPKRKQAILSNDGCCQFKDSWSGRVCGSKFNLEIDHVQPRWASGPCDRSNLRVLCRGHNQYRYWAGS